MKGILVVCFMVYLIALSGFQAPGELGLKPRKNAAGASDKSADDKPDFAIREAIDMDEDLLASFFIIRKG